MLTLKQHFRLVPRPYDAAGVRLGPVLAMKCFLTDVVCSHHGNAVSSDSGVCCLESAVSNGLGVTVLLRPSFRWAS